MDVTQELLEIRVGSTFSSFRSVKEAIDWYQKKQHVQLFISDSRTLGAAAKRAPKIAQKAPTELQYYSLTYACIHGGKKFKSRSNGARPNQHTFRQDCPVKLQFLIDETCKNLKVTSVVEEHNHDVSVAAFRHLPHQRKLSENDEHQAQELLHLRANNKLVQDHIQKKTGKPVSLRDLSNLKAKVKSDTTKNNIEALIRNLQSVAGSHIEVITDEENVLQGIFYQDSDMKRMYESFPEVLIVDATYKLTNLRMPLYVLLNIDGNGESEIVGIFLVSDETAAVMSKMVQAFKATTDAWKNTNVIFTDKDFGERRIFNEEFPHADLLLCLYHVLRSFRREVTLDKMGIRPAQRDTVLEILQRMAYSRTEKEFKDCHEQLKATELDHVISYYEENWHPIRREWVYCHKAKHMTLNTNTTNRLECINQKLKTVCTRFATLNQFFKEFQVILASMRSERDSRALSLIQKIPVYHYSADSPKARYRSLMTPYAYGLFKGKLSAVDKVKITQDGDSFLVESSEGKINTKIDSCQCLFRSSTGLPCHHILAARKLTDENLFDATLVPH